MVDLDGGGGMSGINMNYPRYYLKYTLLLLFRHDGIRNPRFDDDDDDVYNDVWTMWRLWILF